MARKRVRKASAPPRAHYVGPAHPRKTHAEYIDYLLECASRWEGCGCQTMADWARERAQAAFELGMANCPCCQVALERAARENERVQALEACV